MLRPETVVTAVVSLFASATALSDLCRCGTLEISNGGVHSASQLTSLIYPGTSGIIRDDVKEALTYCNPDLGAKGHVILPCLFPEDKHFRPKFENYAQSCGCERTHQVAKGETLWSIAFQSYPKEDTMVASHLIMGCNPGMDPYALVEGQNLRIYCSDDLAGMKQSQKREAHTGRALLNGKSKHKDIYVKEGCPACDVAAFPKKKRGKLDDKALHECGCADKCADCAVNFINGCTSTFGATFEGAFEDTVRPACFMHDACYSCGDVVFKKAIKDTEGRRQKCDELMRDKMRERCDYVYKTESRLRAACRFAVSTYFEAARLLGGRFFRKKCKCPKGWNPYVENLYSMDFCVEPVREGFSLPSQATSKAAEEVENTKTEKAKKGKKKDEGLFASALRKAGEVVEG